MAERVRFPGDPIPGETGEPGKQPAIPLEARVAPVSVEMLDKPKEEEPPQANFRPKPKTKLPVSDDDEDGEEDEDLEDGPSYARERIGARIGQTPDETKQVAQIEEALDKDDVVPCMFQREVRLNHEGLMHTWAPGVHLVPVAIAGRTMKGRHWWLKHNKVRHTGAVQRNPYADNRTQEEVEEA